MVLIYLLTSNLPLTSLPLRSTTT
ncbi:UNVERIFIED_CONTAM: hypothetical protein GTU68_013066 [Idotea baltica]|nr:hypothetical protein [Idotea baltica]